MDNGQGIGAIAGYDYAANGFGPCLVECAAAGGRAELYESDVFDAYGRIVALDDHAVFDVFYALDVTQTAHEILYAVNFHSAGADV